MSTYAKIGIIGPMDVEVELLKSAMESKGDIRSTTVCGRDFLEGTLCGQKIVLVKCGVGMVNAAACTQAIIGQFGVNAVINTGIAGSLDSSIEIGELVIASDAVNHVMDVSNLGYEPGQTPDVDTLAFKADPVLVSAICEIEQDFGIVAHSGRVASGDFFVCSDEEKERITGLFGASCCEMEGAAIAQVCHLSGVPFAIVRAISDKADGSSSVDYPTFEKKAAHESAKLVMELMKRLA